MASLRWAKVSAYLGKRTKKQAKRQLCATLRRLEPLPPRPRGSAQPSASRASVEDSDFFLDLDADSSKRDSVNSDLDINLDRVHSVSERPLSGYTASQRPKSGFASDSPLSAKLVVHAETTSGIIAAHEAAESFDSAHTL